MGDEYRPASDQLNDLIEANREIIECLRGIEALLDLLVVAAMQTEQNTGATMLHTMPFFSRLRFSWVRAGQVIKLTEDEAREAQRRQNMPD
jgi:hypothetical protein